MLVCQNQIRLRNVYLPFNHVATLYLVEKSHWIVVVFLPRTFRTYWLKRFLIFFHLAVLLNDKSWINFTICEIEWNICVSVLICMYLKKKKNVFFFSVYLFKFNETYYLNSYLTFVLVIGQLFISVTKEIYKKIKLFLKIILYILKNMLFSSFCLFF